MRKDVKFGLTIGGILVVTLVVYVVVLTRGGDKNSSSQEVRLVPPAEGGTAPAPAANAGRAEGLTPRESAPVEGAVASVGDAGPTTGAAPATEPSAVSKKHEWEDLMHGVDHLAAPALAEPTITQTPPTVPGGRAVVSIDNHPMIDPPLMTVLPSAPARTDAAEIIPTLDPAPAPPATLPSAMGSTAMGAHKHRVAARETLSTISKAAYGNTKYWDKILGANPGVNPKNLKIGTVLTIPDISNLPAASVSSDHGADLPPPGEGSLPAAAPLDPSASYKVVQGDTLDRIAVKLYGDDQMSDRLYQENKTLIGADRDRLKINWILRLPVAPKTVASAGRVD